MQCRNISYSWATEENMAHAQFILDNQGYKHTLRICNNYCFSTATLVARKGLDVTLYVHCQSCIFKFSLAAHRIRILLHTCFNWKDAAVPTIRYTL